MRSDVDAAERRRRGAVARILGLFHNSHLPVAFDKVGAGRYSDELARPANAAYRDTPMLEDLARARAAQPRRRTRRAGST